MKKSLTFVILLCIGLTSSSAAQSNLDNYKKIDYLTVSEGELNSFLKISKNELKPIYQKLVNSGVIKSWALYRAKYPGGKKTGYDFISITTASDLDRLDSRFSSLRPPKFLPDSVSDEQQKALGKNVTLYKSELWSVENFVSPKDSLIAPSRFLSMGYMDVASGKSPDYLMLEEEIAKPIHKERVNRNNMAGWEVYNLITPGGSQYGYNFSTANYYDQLSDIEFGFTEEVIYQTMGENANISELFNTIYKTRDLVKVELWELQTHTE